MAKEQKEPMAIKKKDLDMFGCPVCGYRGLILERCGRSGLWRCQDPDCNYTCIALFKKAKKSSIGIEFYGRIIYPELQIHPRKGIPVHSGPSLKERLERSSKEGDNIVRHIIDKKNR